MAVDILNASQHGYGADASWDVLDGSAQWHNLVNATEPVVSVRRSDIAGDL